MKYYRSKCGELFRVEKPNIALLDDNLLRFCADCSIELLAWIKDEEKATHE
jgi:hypothetical protein